MKFHLGWSRILPLVALLLGGVPGCGNSNPGNGNGDGGDNRGDGKTWPDGFVDRGDGAPLTDMPICNKISIEAHAVPPNLLLVLDKSGSMKDPISVGSRTSKLQDMKDAVNALLDQGTGKIRFGLLPFPGGGHCTIGAIEVDIADDSVATVRRKVNGLLQGGGTPTGDSLNVAKEYAGLNDQTRRNFVMLVTDGMPTCPNGAGDDENDADNELALQAVKALRTNKIDTFVIGVGEGVNNSNPQLLNDMAEAGGWARAGDPKYYQANTLEGLKTILSDIGGMVVGCSQSLGTKPDFPAYLWVYFDGKVVPRDRQNGWDYDAGRNQIDFFGSFCDQLRTGAVGKVDVEMGCGPET